MLLLTACRAVPPRGGASRPRPVLATWEYEVRASADLELWVDATFSGQAEGALQVDESAEPFVRELAVADGSAFRSIALKDARWSDACAPVCRVRYRMQLRDVAARLADVDVALGAGDAVIAAPSTWAVHPPHATPGARYRFHVTTPPGIRFVTGVRPAKTGAPDTYEADVDGLDESALSAFGRLRVQRLGSKGIDAALSSGFALPDDALIAWLDAELSAVTRYLGRPPDDRLLVIVVPGTSEATRGETLGGGGASVLVRLGTQVTRERLLDDWVVAHELIHVGFPSIGRQHSWLSEGLATYVEPVARARAGLVSAEQVWQDVVEGMPQGLPREGDHGLEGTREWGRVYWGGALYFLLSDLQIRDRTNGARSLDDAVRGVAMSGANVEVRWSLDQVLAVGDRATGTTVLHDLYARFGLAPGAEDLPALWARLGIRREGRTVVFDDRAPWARFRTAITAREPSLAAVPHRKEKKVGSDFR